MNVNPFGSAVRYGGQTTGQESLSNVGEQGSDWGELGQDFISMSAPQQSSAAASNAMKQKEPTR